MANPLNALGIIAASQVMAPVMVLQSQLPSFGKLTVFKVETHEPFQCGRVHSLPERTSISFVDSRGYSRNITIRHDNLAVSSNDSGLFSSPYGGSGGIGIALFGLPSLLLTSPILILNGLTWIAIERAVGMNRWAWTIWLRIKDQLDEPTRAMVKKAFEKMHSDAIFRNSI